jgi:hypothetical protein
MSYRLDYEILGLPENIKGLPDLSAEVESDKYSQWENIDFSSDSWFRLFCYLESRLDGIGYWESENNFMQSDSGGETTKGNILLLAQTKALYKGFDFAVEGKKGGLPFYRLSYDWFGYSDLLEELETSKWFEYITSEGGFHIASGLPCFYSLCPSWETANNKRDFLRGQAIPELEKSIKATGKTLKQNGIPGCFDFDYNYDESHIVTVSGHIVTFEFWEN